MSTVNCPSCGREIEVEDAYRDWTVRCPHCNHEFVPNQPLHREEPRDEPEDDFDEPVYGYDENPYREDAARLVAGPALWLEICGWGGALLTAIGCALLVLLGLEEMNNNRRGGDGEMFLFFSFCLGVFGIPYSIVMGLGGRHMRRFSSRGWAMAGAILGVAAVPLFGVCGVIQTGIGIWALVTLEKPVVRRAFGLPSRGGRRRRDWDD